MNISFTLLALVFIAPFSLLLHELGHVYGAKLMNVPEIKLNIGSGKIIWQQTFNTIEITLRINIFAVIYTQSLIKEQQHTIEKIIITFLGPLFNLLFAFLLFLISKYIYLNEIIYLTFLFNLWLAIVNMIPFKIKENCSDGYTILRLLFTPNKK